MDVDATGLPVLTFGEQSVPPEHTFDVYHDTTAPLFDTGLLVDPGEFRSTAADYLIDDVVVSRVFAGPHTLRRTRRHLLDGTTDWITIQIHHQGGIRGAFGDDSTLDVTPARIGIVDLAKPFAAWSEGGTATWVGVPRDRIDGAGRIAAGRALDRWSPRGRILDAAVAELWARLGDARAGEADALAADIVETVNTLLDPDRFTPTDRDLRVAMERFIKANLSDLVLGVDDLRAAFHCSRSSVYRCFEQHGGVASYIREQRLLRCFDELARPTELPRRIADVATRWGFENPSHFHRLFKAKFGLAPSALSPSIGGHEPYASHSPTTAHQITEFHAWARAS